MKPAIASLAILALILIGGVARYVIYTDVVWETWTSVLMTAVICGLAVYFGYLSVRR